MSPEQVQANAQAGPLAAERGRPRGTGPDRSLDDDALDWPPMKLLEYQAKQRFAAAGIPVPPGRLARTPDEAAAAARELGRVAVKAQVPIGGRGKAGGIAVVDTPEEARREAARILAMDIRGYPGPQRLVRDGARHRGRAVPRHHARSRSPPPRDHLLGRGRDGDRAGRRRGAGAHREALARSVRRAAAVRDPAARVRRARACAATARPRAEAGERARGR